MQSIGKYISKFVLLLSLFVSVELYARCEGDIISKANVIELPDNVFFKDIVLKFGNGCLGGKSVINTAYREKEGKHIFFFLRNKPKKASEYFKEKNPKDIPVYMAVLVDLEKKTQEVIWPRKLANMGYEKAVKQEYTVEPKSCVSPQIDSKLFSNLDVEVLNVGSVFEKFGEACFSGYTAVTLQYIDANGNAIWFWLSNKPKPAFSSIKSNKRNDINIFLIEKKIGDSKGSGQILWPKRLVNTDLDTALHAEYFSK